MYDNERARLEQLQAEIYMSAGDPTLNDEWRDRVEQAAIYLRLALDELDPDLRHFNLRATQKGA